MEMVAVTREADIRSREEYFSTREMEVAMREEQISIRELEAATRGEAMEQRESQLSRVEHEIEVAMEQRTAKAYQDYHDKLAQQEHRCGDWIRRAVEEKDGRIVELEELLATGERSRKLLSLSTEFLQGEVERFCHMMEVTEGTSKELYAKRKAHVKLLCKAFLCVWDAMSFARLRKVGTSELAMDSKENIVVGLNKLADKREGLQEKLKGS